MGEDDRKSDLKIGWHASAELDPLYWIRPEAKAGKHSDEYVVSIPRKLIARHTVIVAQSGSGKSFFLGRLIEEILLKTRCNVGILDPNSDFRKFSTPVSDAKWKDPKYDFLKRVSFLPDEASQQEFKDRWENVSKRIFSRSDGIEDFYPLRFDWLSLSMDLLGEGLPTPLQIALDHCHQFVRSLYEIIRLTQPASWFDEHNILQTAESLFIATRDQNQSDVIKHLQGVFPAPLGESAIELLPLTLIVKAMDVNAALTALYPKAALHRIYGAEIADYYFGTALAVHAEHLLTSPPVPDIEQKRLEVIDLPSIHDARHRLMAVSAFLERIWLDARARWEVALQNFPPQDKGSKGKAAQPKDTRVPRFIVVDEAHNYMPAEVTDLTKKRLREQFRTIAAEGRKFGIFLIIVSQRPDKLDPVIVSECENRAIMKIGADTVLKKTSESLGLDIVPSAMLQRCLSFNSGRVLLVGPWAERGPVTCYTIARRTEEGGGNLDDDYWAQSPA